MTQLNSEKKPYQNPETDYLKKMGSELKTEIESVRAKLVSHDLNRLEEYDIQAGLAHLEYKFSSIQARLLWLNYGDWELSAAKDFHTLTNLGSGNLRSLQTADERLEILLARARTLQKDWKDCDLDELRSMRSRVLKRLKSVIRAGDCLQKRVSSAVETMERCDAQLIDDCRQKMEHLNCNRFFRRLQPLAKNALYDKLTLPTALLELNDSTLRFVTI